LANVLANFANTKISFVCLKKIGRGRFDKAFAPNVYTPSKFTLLGDKLKVSLYKVPIQWIARNCVPNSALGQIESVPGQTNTNGHST
jgi:hypothetical protein